MHPSSFSLKIDTTDDNELQNIAKQAAILFQENGFVRLTDIFSAEFMAELQQFYQAHYLYSLASTNMKDKRPLHTIHVEGPFNSPDYYANKKLLPLLSHLLGDDFIVASFSCVLSFPGSPDQRLHRDSEPLYGYDYSIDKTLPPHSVTLLIPLVDCTLQTGCTRVWPGTHRTATYDEAVKVKPIDPELSVGSVLMTDSRVLHQGAANTSMSHRPLLYITYHRHWFRDFWGYDHRPPVSISRRELAKVPQQHRQRFMWTRYNYKKWHIKQAFFRLLPQFVINKLQILKGS
jgi:hypothetical protein